MIPRVHRSRRRIQDGDRLVEAALGAVGKPLSAYEIRDHLLAGGDRISIPQVYRIVARLLAKQRIRRVETLSGYILGGGRDDAILICMTCGSATPVPIGQLAEQLSLLMEERGFEIHDIIVEGRGRCHQCLRMKGGQ